MEQITTSLKFIFALVSRNNNDSYCAYPIGVCREDLDASGGYYVYNLIAILNPEKKNKLSCHPLRP